jgi:WD40 repeat protein/tRNA A-37 threonylcarbamoyl transferase component Bud32
VDPGAAWADERRSDPLAPGARIGRFTVLRKLGEGGMGIVHAAYDDELDRKIAIKLVRAERVDDLARARVLREAQAMARVSHPNVVQIYEVGVHGEQVYVAMEFVAGPTLAAAAATWRERAQVEGRLAWAEILARYVDAGRGLAAAHAAGLVHRDFKPANAIVGDDGRVRVLDFGIARPIANEPARPRSLLERERAIASGPSSPTHASTSLTRTGAQVGTPAYMSPEQFEAGNIDARSDQFSFCVALWEALYGERPFAGRDSEALLDSMYAGSVRATSSTSGVPPWLRERIRRGLALDPAERWPSMAELLDALTDDPDRRRRARWRRSLIAVVALGLLGALLAFAREQMASATRAELERAQALDEEAAARRRTLAAQAERDEALDEARANAVRARDTARILAGRSLTRDPTLAAALLREVENPQAPGWRSAALEILQRPISRVVIADHDDRVVDVEFSPEGTWLASASFDGRVRVWSSAALGSGHYYLLAHDDRVFDIDFDPGGRRLVSSSRDETARVWTLPEAAPSRAGQPLEPSHVLRGHDSIIWTARFSPTGDRVVTAARAGEVWVWPIADVREPSPSQRLTLDGIAWHAEFSPEGDQVAIASDDGRVRLWDVERDQVRELWRHGGVAWVAHFSPDGRWVASASQTGEVRLDPVEPERRREGTTLRGHTAGVQRLSYAPDGRALASCSRDRTARLWSLDEQGRPRGPARVIEVGTSAALSPEFSPDSRWLALGGVEPTVRVVAVAGGHPIDLRGHTSDVFSLRFSPDGARLVTGSYDRSLRIWDADWSRIERRFTGEFAPDPAGRWLLEHRDDQRVRLWRVEVDRIMPRGSTSETIATGTTMLAWSTSGASDWLVLPGDRGDLLGFELDERRLGEQDLPARWRIADLGELVGVQLSGDGRWLVAGTLAGEVELWHFAEGLAGGPRAVELGEGRRHVDPLAVLGLGPDGRTLISTSIRGDVRITALDPDTGEVGESRLHAGVQSGRNNAVAFDPEGEWVVITALDRSIRVWSLDRPEQPPITVMLTSEARSMLYDADGDRLLLACGDGQLRSFDPHGGAVATLDRMDGNPSALELAARRPWLAFGAADGELVVRAGPSEPLELAIDGGIRRLDFAADEHRLIVSDARRTLRVLHVGEDLDAASLLARMRGASDYCPSLDERVRYAGESPETAGRACGSASR